MKMEEEEEEEEEEEVERKKEEGRDEATEAQGASVRRYWVLTGVLGKLRETWESLDSLRRAGGTTSAVPPFLRLPGTCIA